MKFLLAILVGVLAGIGAYTFYYAKGFSYLSNDPRACVNCHIMREQYDGWQKGSHHGVATCNDCHVPHTFFAKWFTKASNGYHHSEGFTLQNFHEPIRIKPASSKILNSNCLYCHKDFVHDIAVADAPQMKNISCVHCHDNVGHGPSR